MAFPDTPLDVRTELLLGGTWTDVTLWNDHGPITIGRGHPDESTTASASELSATFTNNDGRFTSRNPTGPYYGNLGRNVPIRVSIPSQYTHLRLEANNRDRAYVNETSTLDITGSIEMRIALRLSDWGGCILACKWDGGGCWYWQLSSNGTMTFGWTDASASFQSVTSSAAVPMVNADTALRVTMNTATGTVTFYTAASIDGTYTQLGVASSGTGGAATSIRVQSGSPLVMGYSFNFTPGQLLGRVYEYRLYNGIGGTIAADAVFTSLTAGTTSWTDAAGNTWQLAGGAEISSRNYRCHVEVPEWPQHQDESGKTVTVKVAGGGLLRRAAQRNNPVNSALYRAYTRLAGYPAPVAYWPMEDGTSATQCASALGGPAMYFSGAPNLASSSAFACSTPLPVANGATFTGNVPGGVSWTDNVARFLMQIPAGGEPNGSLIASVSTLGTVATFRLSYGSGGSMALTGYDSSGNQLFTSGPLLLGGASVNGAALRVGIALQNAGGGNITYSVQTLAPGAPSAGSFTGTVAGTIGPVSRVQLNPGGTLTQTAFGHCSVQPVWDTLFDLNGYQTPAGLWTGALNAWIGEPAGRRFARLCSEEGIPFRGRGNLDTTPPMGAQTTQTAVQLLQECADADRGVWTELRQALGFGYVTRSALYNQAAQVTVDYSQDHLSMWAADPLEDDQTTVNDVTVTQTSGGSSSRKLATASGQITGGRLSTQAPPNGVGVYDQTYSINLANAADLDNQAGWILHVGTVDQPRFPGILLDLSNRDLAALYWQILGMDLGDRLVINHPPVWLPPDPVSQICAHLAETLWAKQLEIIVVGVPELPYEVAQDGAGYHVDTDGSTLAAAVSSTATSLSVATAAGYPLWTTAAGDFPFDISIAGERVTVTNITGTSSPQTFTVTRSVNGVVKAQAVNAAVALFNTPVAAL